MLPKQKKPTMPELAKLAGVDVSTVSRALNDSPVVKSETKERIRKIAEETGYVMNVSARNLRKQSSGAIGIVIPLRPESGQGISDPFFLEMVGAVSSAASKRGYDLIVHLPEGEQTIAEKRLLQTGRADGLIVIGQAGLSERLNRLGDVVNKVVVWGGSEKNESYTLVGSDNKAGGYAVGAHLLSLGKQRILFIGSLALPEVKLRYNGLLEAYSTINLTHPSDLVLELDFGGQEAYDRVARLIEDGCKFDAIFASSDVLAIAALHAVQAKGLSVPGDVAVAGYDNIGQSGLIMPPITTVDQNIKLGGEIMVNLLLRKLAGEEVSSQLTPTSLIVRETTVTRIGRS
jgi:DNA-binding LacI/PurR family transcriptional regulator